MLDKVKQIKHFEQGIEFRFDAKDFKRLMASIDVPPAQVIVGCSDFDHSRGFEFVTVPQGLFGLVDCEDYVLLQVVKPGLRFQDGQVVGFMFPVEHVAAVWKRIQADGVEVVNLTPHDIHVWKDGKVVGTFPRSGKVARLREQYQRVDEVLGVEVVERKYEAVEVVSKDGKVEELPPVRKGVFYLVSALVLAAVARPDLLAPDTGVGAVRDDKGRIVGTRRFVVFKG